MITFGLETLLELNATSKNQTVSNPLPNYQLTAQEWAVVGLHCFFIPIFILSIPPIILVALTRFDIVKTKKILFACLLCTPVVQIMNSVMTLVSYLSLLAGRNRKTINAVNETFQGLSSTCLILLYALLQYQLLIILYHMNLVCKTAKILSERTIKGLTIFLWTIGIIFTVVELPLLFGINIAYGLVETYSNEQGMMILYVITGIICVSLALYFLVSLTLMITYVIIMARATRGDSEKRPQAIRAVIYGVLLILVSIVALVTLLLSAAAPGFGSSSLFVYMISAILLTISLIIFVWVVLVLYGSLSALKVKFEDVGKSLNSTEMKSQQAFPVDEEAM